MKLEQLGRHILVEFYNCNLEVLGDEKKIEEIMCEAAIRSNATIVNSCFHKFDSLGVSGAVIIKESHLTIHTWPEYGYASADLYTCGESVNPWLGFNYLEKMLQAEKSESTEIARGIVEKIKNYSHDNLLNVTYKPISLNDKEIK